MNDYVHIEAADLRRPNARFTTERQGYQVLTPFGKLGYSRIHRLTDAISVDVIDFLENEAYDDLLSENLVFIDLYDTSANNTVIESIARGTPIVVCRHPAVEEYLGSDYPLFFDELDQVPKLLMDASRIEAAHQMLKQDEIRRPLRIGYFADAFARSDVVQHAVE